MASFDPGGLCCVDTSISTGEFCPDDDFPIITRRQCCVQGLSMLMGSKERRTWHEGRPPRVASSDALAPACREMVRLPLFETLPSSGTANRVARGPRQHCVGLCPRASPAQLQGAEARP